MFGLCNIVSILIFDSRLVIGEGNLGRIANLLNDLMNLLNSESNNRRVHPSSLF